MTDLINNLSTALFNAVLFAAAVFMVGLGFAVVGALALFALLAVGFAMIAAPFAAKRQPADADVVA